MKLTMNFTELPDALITDLDNTLVSTKESSKLIGLLKEYKALTELKNTLDRLGSICYQTYGYPFKLIIVTGNSFDYVMAKLEVYSLWTSPTLEVIVASENGLYTQSLRRGILWKFEPSADYLRRTSDLMSYALKRHRGRFYLQGNLVRITFKALDSRYFDEELAPELIELGRKLGFELYEGGGLKEGRVGTMYWHKGDALDIDPFKGRIGGREAIFEGKSFPVRELSKEVAYALVVGDSLNDLPMFQEAHSLGYSCFVVKNHSLGNKLPPYVKVLEEPLARGVNLLLLRVLREWG